MSGFDVTFRTQQMLAPYQMADAQAKTQGIQNIGNAAIQTAGFVMDNARANADLQMRQARSDAEIASFQQEQQLNAYKLQQVMALDQAAVSRFGVTMAGVQARMAELEMQQKESMLKQADDQHSKSAYELALSMGLDLDMTSGKAKPFASKQDYDEALKKYQSVNFHPRSGDSYSPMLEQSRLASMIEKLRITDPEVAAVFSRQLRTSLGLPEEPPDQTTAPAKEVPHDASQASQRAFLNTVIQDKALSAMASSVLNDQRWESSPFWSKFGQDTATRELMSASIAASARDLRGMQSELGRDADPSYMLNWVMAQAEREPRLMTYLLWRAKDDPATIRMKLNALFPDRQGAVDYAINQIPSFSESK